MCISNSYITGVRDVWHLLHISPRAHARVLSAINAMHSEWHVLYSATSLIRHLGLSPAYLCACVEGMTVRIQWVWPLPNEAARHICWLENARNDEQRFFFNLFGVFLK